MALMSLKDRVSEQVHSAGWQRPAEFDFKNTALVATKTFDSAVGPKSAWLYLTPWPEGDVVLTGHYESEGRNIVSDVMVTLDVNVSDHDLQFGVSSLVRRVEKAINHSYAVRLLRTA